MNVDLEALCKVYLMSCGSDLHELSDILDREAEAIEEKYLRKLSRSNDVSEEEAEFLAKLYRGGIVEGLATLFMVFKRLISDEMRREYNEFRDETQGICPVCKYGLYGNSEYIPVYDALCHTSYECFKCGYKHEFPKAMLVRDIFTEYANKQKEEEE